MFEKEQNTIQAQIEIILSKEDIPLQLFKWS